MEYPYIAKILDDPKIMFHRLKTQSMNIIYDENKIPILKRLFPEDYFKTDYLSDHFSEKVRITCKSKHRLSPKEAWNKIKKDSSIKTKTILEKREFIYKIAKPCNTFNVSFYFWIINQFINEKCKILDPSSGWGDRLIGALANNSLLYHGFDPNKKLKPCYDKIVKTFNNNTEVIIKMIPFEDSILLDNFYDIVLTSPPFFDLEIYTNDKTQSIKRYNTYTDWLKFIHIYIDKIIKAIKVNGYMILYVSNFYLDNKYYKMKDDIYNYIKTYKNIKKVKVLGLCVSSNDNNDKVRYVTVWQKSL